MKDVPRNQSLPPRRSIILRPSELTTDGSSAPVSDTPAPIRFTPSASSAPSDNNELQGLREELAQTRRHLEEGTPAEWSRERHFFQLMSDNVSDLIVLLDHQGHRTWNNPAYSRVLGYPPEDLKGTYALAEVHPDDQARATEALNQTIQHASTQQVEYRLRQKDGGWVHLQTETIPILDSNGHVESILLLAVDKTEIKKLSEALALASTEANAASLIEGMARDFDQILTNIFGNLTIAKNLNGPHNAVAVRLHEIERSLQRARDLIEQVFSITPEQSQPKVQVALEPLVQEVANAVLRGTMIRAEYVFPRNLPDIEIDKEALSHAIRNIVTNSLEAMDNGVVRFSAEKIPHAQFSYRPDPAAQARRLHLPPHPGSGTRHPGKGAPAHLRPLLHHAQRFPWTRAHHRPLLDPAHGRHDPYRLHFRCRHHRFRSISRSPPASLFALVRFPVRHRHHPAERPALPGWGARATRAQTADSVNGRRTDDSRYCQPDARAPWLRRHHLHGRLAGHRHTFAKAKSQSEPFDLVMMDLVVSQRRRRSQDAVHTIKKIDPEAKILASSGHLEHPVMLDHKKFGFNAVLEKPYKLEKLQQAVRSRSLNEPTA